ncbi:hypothetical protein [Endozoicomonas sp. SESOKO1]|uniref:hypothetical protein n=1 Tax=Endozoicomonas sp. SESOKO1 TaxID=2828742 RepID=UPI0021473117|nr:hypothetical protein [Endozoicomonas sp. SESOKO1]
MMKVCMVVVMLILSGCHLQRPMTGATLRAALDECQENDLASLVYVRTDSSVMGVRCIPRKDQVARTIRIRPYTPMKIIRTFAETEEVVE